MGDFEDLITGIGYLVALDESKTNQRKNSGKIKIDLKNPFVAGYVNSILKESNNDNALNILFDCIEFYFFSSFIQSKCGNFSDYSIMNKIKIDSTGKKLYISGISCGDKQSLEFMEKAGKSINIKKYLDGLLDLENEQNVDLLIKDIIEFVEEHEFDNFKESDYYIRYLQWKYKEITLNVNRKDFYIHLLLGSGGFGEVYGVHNILTGKMYAMKCLDKKILKSNKCEYLALNERKMMSDCDSEFLVNLAYSFQSRYHLYLIMDLMEGGDLEYHINKRFSFTGWETTFYAAEILLGLEYLHARKIIYLDLKPNNVLLDSDGHSRLSDFGLAIFESDNKKKGRGTPGYIAPEVIVSEKFDHVCDYYSYGVTILKMSKGKIFDPKSYFNSGVRIGDLILETSDTSIIELVSKLLEKRPQHRLGSGDRGIQDIKLMDVFNEIDWEKLFKKQITPPIVPLSNEINSDMRHNYNRKINDRTIKVTDEDQKMYTEFDYANTLLWRKEILSTVLVPVEKLHLSKSLNKKQDYNYVKKLLSDKSMINFGMFEMLSKNIIIDWKKVVLVIYSSNIDCFIYKTLTLYKRLDYDSIIDFELIEHKSQLCMKLVYFKQTYIFCIKSTKEIEWWFKYIKSIIKNHKDLAAVDIPPPPPRESRSLDPIKKKRHGSLYHLFKSALNTKKANKSHSSDSTLLIH